MSGRTQSRPNLKDVKSNNLSTALEVTKDYIFMGKIKLDNIRIFAHHGCLTEENKIGSDYRVDLEVQGNLRPSAKTDQLSDTVNYVFLNRVVREEMLKPSHLLETVAKRILDRIFTEDDLVQNATVWVSKINPPIGGDVEQVTIEMSESRASTSLSNRDSSHSGSVQ